jgi:hypothetical protein
VHKKKESRLTNKLHYRKESRLTDKLHYRKKSGNVEISRIIFLMLTLRGREFGILKFEQKISKVE